MAKVQTAPDRASRPPRPAAGVEAQTRGSVARPFAISCCRAICHRVQLGDSRSHLGQSDRMLDALHRRTAPRAAQTATPRRG